MSENETGGPAFPGALERYHSQGMTLRDYFAAKAMPTLIANPDTDLDDDVRIAYLIADKMLEARK